MLTPNPPAWVAAYVGIPFNDAARAGDGANGFNCWGLFAAVQRDVFGFDIADYEGPLWKEASAAAMGEAARAFAARFVTIEPGGEKEGDAVLMRVSGVPIHIGVVIVPGEMLHVERGADACREEYRTGVWARRIAGFYRPAYRENCA